MKTRPTRACFFVMVSRERGASQGRTVMMEKAVCEETRDHEEKKSRIPCAFCFVFVVKRNTEGWWLVCGWHPLLFVSVASGEQACPMAGAGLFGGVYTPSPGSPPCSAFPSARLCLNVWRGMGRVCWGRPWPGFPSGPQTFY